MAYRRKLHICCLHFVAYLFLTHINNEEFIAELQEFFLTELPMLYWMGLFFLIAESLELFTTINFFYI